ncbi:unnamed protein product [Boreogadus saida]
MEALVKQPGEANTAQPALHQELMGALTAGRKLNILDREPTDRDQLVDLVEGPQYRPGSAGGPGGRSPVQTGISWWTKGAEKNRGPQRFPAKSGGTPNAFGTMPLPEPIRQGVLRVTTQTRPIEVPLGVQLCPA